MARYIRYDSEDFVYKNFFDKTQNHTDLKNGLTFVFGKMGVGKTTFLKKSLYSEKKFLYIGRGEGVGFSEDIEEIILEEFYKREKLPCRILLAGSYRSRNGGLELEHKKLYKAIQELLQKQYVVVFDEAFFDDKGEYDKLITLVLKNKECEHNIAVVSHRIDSLKERFGIDFLPYADTWIQFASTYLGDGNIFGHGITKLEKGTGAILSKVSPLHRPMENDIYMLFKEGIEK